MRKPGSERGTSEFVPISWEDALDMLNGKTYKKLERPTLKN